jgi:hypothetical protein
MPTTFNGSLQSAAEVAVPGEGKRASIDMDDFHCGFGTWSGTSFAAPVLAGELAQCLLATRALDEVTAAVAVPRTLAALASLRTPDAS